MHDSSNMIPVLQLSDLDALEEAQEYLGRHGYRTKVTPFEDLPESAQLDWMMPEDGGYLIWVDASEYEAAMDMLNDFFGYSEDTEEEDLDFYPEDDY